MATPRRRKANTTPPRQKTVENGEFYDATLEFDAPMYYNFAAQTPQSGRKSDLWFENRLKQIGRGELMEPDYSPLTFQRARGVSKASNVPKTSLQAEKPQFRLPSSPAARQQLPASPKPANSHVEDAPLPLSANLGENVDQLGVGPPVRKRKNWAKPEAALKFSESPSKTQALSNKSVSTDLDDKLQEEPRRPVTRLSLALRASKLQAANSPPKPTPPAVAPSRRSLTRNHQIKPKTQENPRILSLTAPKEFSFMARGPAPTKSSKPSYVPEKIIELTTFPSLLRSTSAPPRQPQGLTRPVEFHFATTARAKNYTDHHPAEFELAPKSQLNKTSISTRAITRSQHGHTQPQEFKFATATRARAAAPPEDFQHKAPQNTPKPTRAVARRVTVPQAFHLSTSNRPRSSAEETQPKPITRRTEAGPRVLTVPVTPRVTLRKRKLPEQVEETVPNKRGSLPAADPRQPRVLTVPVTPRITKPKRKTPEKAVQAPVVDKVPEPRPHLTVCEPFELQSEMLSLAAKQKFEERILHEQALEAAMRNFKANPPISLKRAPFRPLTSNRLLTVPETPNLKSGSRATDRAEFSVEKNQRARLKEERAAQDKAQEEENERQEIIELRKTLEFKATPFVNPPAPMPPAPSSRPLTLPQSPQFRTNLRSMR